MTWVRVRVRLPCRRDGWALATSEPLNTAGMCLADNQSLKITPADPLYHVSQGENGRIRFINP